MFSQPIQSRSTYFTVLARPNGKTFPRLGVVIAKRYVRSSVDRSRLKRLIRESFRVHQQALAGLDVIVLRRNGERKEMVEAKLPNILEKQWQEVVWRWKNG